MNKEGRNILVVSLVLIIIGLITIYSSSYVWANYKFNNKYHYLIYQSIFLVIGLVVLRLTQKVKTIHLKKYINIFLLIGILLLILVVVPGIGVIRNGSRSWFSLGPFSFQPSEIMKIILFIYTAKYLEKYHQKINKVKDTLFPLLLILGLVIVLIMLEPDFGSSMIIILSVLSMIFISGLKYKFFSFIGIIGLILITVIIIFAPYRLARIVSFLNPWSDPLGSGYQIIQSLYAIGPGGLFGQGLFHSRQKNFYLPEPQTDFIFSIFCEELGFIAAVIVIFLFIYLFYNMYKVSAKQSNLFNKFLSFGIFSSLAIQTSMNLCVVVGLVPVTGVTLPFFSYGGSSLLTVLLSIGILLNISNHK